MKKEIKTSKKIKPKLKKAKISKKSKTIKTKTKPKLKKPKTTFAIVRNLKTLKTSSIKDVGGKAKSLGKLMDYKFNVPNGYVISSSAYFDFLKENDLNKVIDKYMNRININKPKTINKASKKIQKLFLKQKLSINLKEKILEEHKNLNNKYVAVRSSATAEDSKKDSWAGQLDTYLNVKDIDLFRAIKRCWASLYNERAIYYGLFKKIKFKEVGVAVVVQEMVDAEKSGVAFSIDPVSHNKFQIIIEATYGLGEAVVSSQISADNYVVSKQKYKIIQKNIVNKEKALVRKEDETIFVEVPENQSNKNCLSQTEISTLCKIIIDIEKKHKYPVDIEWAIYNKKVYVLQARPITTIIEEKI